MTARDDDLDDTFIARYADRIDDETEVLWRADFDRVIDFENRGFDEDASLLPRAREIRARWAADPVVGPSWSDLDEIHDGWIQAPEAMKQAHEVFMPGGLRPPGMSDTRWSSHMQAREMTGHGAWPGFEPTYSQDVSERHEPMTDTTDRAHVLDSETESDIERELRTDYERAAQVYSSDPNEYDPADAIDAGEYASTWLNHEDHRFGDTWVAITEAEHLWQTDPEAAAAQLADTSTAPLQRRTLEHARDMSRGIYARDMEPVIDRVTGTADSSSPIPAPAPVERPMTQFDNGLPSWDASRNDPARPVPQFATSVVQRTSALANYKPGNTLAAAMERQFEHEGAER